MPLSDLSRAAPVPESGPFGAGGTLAPFRYPAFRAIWIANSVSSVGSLIQAVAASWVMTELTSSHQLIAAVTAANTLPVLLLGLIAGAIADNYDRRLVMIAAQTAMLVVSGILAFLSYRGAISPFLLIAATLGIGLGTALNGPAWQASVRQQVGHKDLPQAVALNAVSFNLARSVGPALGGLLISLWHPSLAFALNSLSFVGMIVVLVRWKPETSTPAREPMFASIATGLRFCFSSHPIRRVLIRAAAFGFGATAFQALMPAVARSMVGGSGVAYGMMLGAFGVGSVAAAPVIGAVRRRFGSEIVLTGSSVLFAASLVGLALARSEIVAMAAALFGGVAWVSALTSTNVAMQLRSPEAILGRCLSLYQSVLFGAMSLGAWAWGYAADRVGLAGGLELGGAWLVLTLVLRFVAPMPRREEGRIDPGADTALREAAGGKARA